MNDSVTLSDDTRRSFQLNTGRLIAAIALALIWGTWRLWFPATDFPQVPLIAPAWTLPVAWQTPLAIVLVGSLFATVFQRKLQYLRWLLLFEIALLSLLVLANQHRLQPWVYHFLLSAWAVAMLDGRRLQFWLRALLISIYFYSAISKFDLRFAQTTGAMFITSLVRLFSEQAIAPHRIAALAWLLPLGELAVAVLLFFRITRRLGVACAIVLHLMLLLILGPWGLQQRPGVLIWNIGCLLQVGWLFRHSVAAAPGQAETATSPGAHQRRHIWSSCPLLAALLWPCLEPAGLCDSWLAWGLYSTRAARTEVFVASEVVKDLPETLQNHCRWVGDDRIWARIAKSNWSLETLRVPLYPHERFDLAIDLAMIDQLPPNRRWFRIQRSGRPNRWTGEVEVTTIQDERQLREQVKRGFFWNATPRDATTAEQ